MIDKIIQEKILSLNSIEKIQDTEINTIEKILKIKFHSDYKWIIKNFGYLIHNDCELAGIALDNVEGPTNIVTLNKQILGEYKLLPRNWVAISFTNKYDKILVLDNDSGNIFAYSYDLKKNSKLFDMVNDLLKDIYFPNKSKLDKLIKVWSTRH